MPLVNAKCTNCGANLEVDSAKDAANCPYCGAAYIVEKAINNYNTTINTTNNINAEVVNVYGGNSGDFVIRGGVLEKYIGASQEVIIPDNVSFIGACAFMECKGVTKIIIPNTVSEIGEMAFRECKKLKTITLPDGLISIPKGAFSMSGITHIDIPESVRFIGDSAFCLCDNLREITLPKGLEGIGSDAFSSTGLTSIDIPSGVDTIQTNAFGAPLESIVLHEGLRNIKRGAFHLSHITKLVIPETVETIEGNAFGNCSRLEEVIFLGKPKMKKYIDDDSYERPFDGCMKLFTINADEEWIRENADNFSDEISGVKAGYRCPYCYSRARDKRKSFFGRVIGYTCRDCGKEYGVIKS